MLHNKLILTSVMLKARIESLRVADTARDLSGKEPMLGQILRAIKEQDHIGVAHLYVFSDRTLPATGKGNGLTYGTLDRFDLIQ